MKKEHEPNIPEEECEDGTDDNSLQDSSSFSKPALNDVEQGVAIAFIALCLCVCVCVCVCFCMLVCLTPRV